MKPIAPALCIALMATSVFADDAPKPMGPEFCFPTEDITKTLAKFDGLKEKRRDRVGADFMISLDPEEGEALPERIEIRESDTARIVPFDEYNRSVGLTDMLRTTPEDAELCVVDPAREGRMPEDMGYEFDFGMGVRFKSAMGTHSLAEIDDGLKDGRSHYKKMAGAMGFMVPKFDHIAVAGRDEDNPPRVYALKGGVELGELGSSLFNGGRMIDVDVLEEMGADAIRIDADYYRMSPSPDEKTVRKFMGGDDDEVEEG